MLSGGSTPAILYKYLLQNMPESIELDHIHIFWGDERCVPSYDPESNYGQAKKLWLDKIPLNENQLHPLYSGLEIEEELRQNENQLEKAGIFNLVILGLGEDGHFASVFPDRPDLFDSHNLCETTHHPVTKQQRITVTPRFLQIKAEIIILIVTGRSKASIIKQILNEEKVTAPYLPAARLKKTCPQLHLYLDEEAAG